MKEGVISIAPSRDHLLKDGKKLFLLADTAWSAFTNATLEEWEHYLDQRVRQGFNAVLINILPQWDRSGSELELHPFRLRSDRSYDYLKPDEAYFGRAARMLQMAVAKGVKPALVLLWADHVPGTWLNRALPEHVMPPENFNWYVVYVVENFRTYDPIYLVSGDTDFESEETVQCYLAALEVLKSIVPEALAAFHISGFQASLPPRLAASPHLDLYLYQSGHLPQAQPNAYRYAERFASESVKRPLLNAEPCYEGFGFEEKRFSAGEVRRAIWQSLLSGAKSGVAYGAHGIWSWHRQGKGFPPSDAHIDTPYNCLPPYDWRAALGFGGAWDAGFARWLYETMDLFALEPLQALVEGNEEIRLSATPDLARVAIYSPGPAEVRLNLDLTRYDWTEIDLGRRRFGKPLVMERGGRTVFGMPLENNDVLLLGERKSSLSGPGGIRSLRPRRSSAPGSGGKRDRSGKRG
jgi:hypothetical protein